MISCMAGLSPRIMEGTPSVLFPAGTSQRALHGSVVRRTQHQRQECFHFLTAWSHNHRHQAWLLLRRSEWYLHPSLMMNGVEIPDIRTSLEKFHAVPYPAWTYRRESTSKLFSRRILQASSPPEAMQPTRAEVPADSISEVQGYQAMPAHRRQAIYVWTRELSFSRHRSKAIATLPEDLFSDRSAASDLAERISSKLRSTFGDTPMPRKKQRPDPTQDCHIGAMRKKQRFPSFSLVCRNQI